MLRSIDEGEKKGREPNAQQDEIVAAGLEYADEAIEVVVRAYHDLETCRPIGLIAGLIPWTAMDRWCEVEQLDDEARRIVIGALRYVDVEDFKKRTAKKTPPTTKGRR